MILKEEFHFHIVHNLPCDNELAHGHLCWVEINVEVEDSTGTIRVRHELLRDRLAPITARLNASPLINDIAPELAEGSMEAISAWIELEAAKALEGVPGELPRVGRRVLLKMAETTADGRRETWHGCERP